MDHLYLTRNMVAREPMLYLGKDIVRGQHFHATEHDAEYFKKHGKADDVRAPAAPSFMTAPAPAVVEVQAQGLLVGAAGAMASTVSEAMPDRAAFVAELLTKNAAAVIEALPSLDDETLAAVKDAEAAGKARKGLTDAFVAEDARRAAAAEGDA